MILPELLAIRDVAFRVMLGPPDPEIDLQISVIAGIVLETTFDPEGRASFFLEDGAPLPSFTESFDAAISIIPKGWRLEKVEFNGSKPGWVCVLLRGCGSIRAQAPVSTAGTIVIDRGPAAIVAAALKAIEFEKGIPGW